MNYTQYSCEDFVRILASDAPTPGGGGGAALVGALGVALSNMVGSLTVGKKQYQAVQEEILQLQSAFDDIQQRLLYLIDRDAAGFAPLLAAYALPAGSEAEKSHKLTMVDAASAEACTVPLEIMRCCNEALPLIQRMVSIGSKMAVSDAGCAASFCRASLESASLNVFVNTRTMSDRHKAEQLIENTRTLLACGLPLAEAIFSDVQSRLL